MAEVHRLVSRPLVFIPPVFRQEIVDWRKTCAYDAGAEYETIVTNPKPGGGT